MAAAVAGLSPVSITTSAIPAARKSLTACAAVMEPSATAISRAAAEAGHHGRRLFPAAASTRWQKSPSQLASPLAT